MTCVLVVDDSRLARRVTAEILGRIRPDWLLIEASNAEEAMAALHEREVGIALLDINMPGTDGLTLAQKVCETRPELAVAIVSANIQDDVIARTRAMGATFIPKPLTDEALVPFLNGAALRMRQSRPRTDATGSAV